MTIQVHNQKKLFEIWTDATAKYYIPSVVDLLIFMKSLYIYLFVHAIKVMPIVYTEE